ncbi:HsdR family type I site-specific deoxyribonuclease [Draconibacterium orientale]|uniref:type I restriction endonuclease subunit R n=1 Tax=Draconibacterium orientale TaxID=1168034 RepID=UPI002A0A7E2C|nr:HsdR family type I site-specific deoxyribonuclease [Draconibacterium orientale]
MAEYINVEKPFLDKLRLLGWTVIDQGLGVPQDSKKSLRENFKQVVLPKIFKDSIRKINVTSDGKEWLTEKQLDEILFEIQNFAGKSLHEANKAIHRMLLKGTSVAINNVTGEQNPTVRLVDFKKFENNSFIAINQFRLITPGASRQGIIPDIVLFLNGLPIVVIEAKDFDVAEPLSEAFIQVTRYANTRDDDYGAKEGEERLFHYNIFSIITHGKEARVGTITAEFDFYNNWVDIFPEEYKVVEYPPNEERQEVLIHGMLNKEILLDILKHFTLFAEIKKGVEVKIVTRYNQYRAVGKIINNLREGGTPLEKSGVVWHTQGSGKSLAMVFLIRKLRSCVDLKDLKIIFVVDRLDLEEQLSETAELTGEPVRVVARRNRLHLLSDDTGDVNMVMIHKFLDENNVSAQSLIEAGVTPKFKKFEPVNNSDRILMLIDEAHRTQGGDMGDNLFSAFPNATRIGFTGTPLLTERHKIKTHERFGGFIDFYKFDTAVKDRATVEIKYIGKVSKDYIDDKDLFDAEFEDMFRQRSKEEKEEIQRRYGSLPDYLESKERVAEIATDIIEHYATDILVNGFKAQVVASSIVAAVRYKYELEKAISNKIEQLKTLPESERDIELISQLEFLKVAVIVSSLGNNEPGYISQARREARDTDAKNNFKKDYDYSVDEKGQFVKPETGIGIICVCDRLLTGFDAPVEQVMYLDRNLREHDLFQAITRVNRTKKGKSFGLIVDYFGVTKHLAEALEIYTDNEEDTKAFNNFLDVFRDINKEIPVLEARYKRLTDLFHDNNLKLIDEFLNQKISDEKKDFDFAEECIQKAKDIKFRAELLTYSRSFFDSLDLLFNTSIGGDYWLQAKRLGYLLWRIRDRYKDDTMDLKWASSKVRKLIDKHLFSMGIDTKVEKVSILSSQFRTNVDNQNRTPSSKASEMEHAIRWHIKVNLDKDPALYAHFKDRLEMILNSYKENWEEIVIQLDNLRAEMAKGRIDPEPGITKAEAPFYDLLKNNLSAESPADIEKTKKLTNSLFVILKETATINNFWSRATERRSIEGIIEDEIRYSGIKELMDKASELTTELMKLAKNRGADLK